MTRSHRTGPEDCSTPLQGTQFNLHRADLVPGSQDFGGTISPGLGRPPAPVYQPPLLCAQGAPRPALSHGQWPLLPSQQLSWRLRAQKQVVPGLRHPRVIEPTGSSSRWMGSCGGQGADWGLHSALSPSTVQQLWEEEPAPRHCPRWGEGRWAFLMNSMGRFVQEAGFPDIPVAREPSFFGTMKTPG